MKYTKILTMGAMLLGAGSLAAQSTETAYTDPSGYVTVEITPAPGAGSSSTSAFSVSLRNNKKFSSAATSVNGQTVTVSGQSWTPNTQWADSATPHLAYLANANGVQAFLITANTADTLTLDTSINLQTLFANNAALFIVEATTLGRLFGTTSAEVKFLQAAASTDADNLFIWGGSNWQTYFHNGTSWKSSSNPFGNANNDVIFPDDGVFVLRRSTEALSLVFTGSVPVSNQLTNIPSGSSFIGSRYPVDTKLVDMNINSLTGWVTAVASSDADRVFYWSGNAWITYWHNGTSWKSSANPFGNADNEVIPGNSALFIVKDSAGGGSATADIPYNLDQ